MEAGEMEGEARQLLQAAGYDDDEAPPMRLVAEGNIGPGCVLLGSIPGTRGGLSVGDWICVHPRLSPSWRRFTIAHELAEWHLKRINYVEGDVEEVANGIAAALVVPRRAYLRSLVNHGEDWQRLARGFCASQTCVLLRHAEVTRTAAAVLGPTVAYVRHGDDWQWPCEEHLRRHLDALPRRVRRVEVTDSRRRFALLA